MAQLKRQDGTLLTDSAQIDAYLSPLNIQLRHWPINPQVQTLLTQDRLETQQKEELATAHDHYFDVLKEEEGYTSRDVIVLFPDLPQLDGLLEKFSRIHTHDDNEIRYIIDGEGVFGFVLPNDEQVLLTVEAGDYINVPKDTEHWFVLTEQKRIKALRYFSTTEGWTPRYTERPIHPSLL